MNLKVILKKLLLFSTGFVILFLSYQNFTTPSVYKLYLSPSGKDSASGTDSSHPIQSLSRALALVKAKRAKADLPVTLYFDEGTYYGQSLVWDSFSKNYKTQFLSRSGKVGSVIFDGRQGSSEDVSKSIYFLYFKFPSTVTRGQKANILVRDLQVQNYLEAITFTGVSRNEPLEITDRTPSLSMSYVEVSNSRFYNIGNRHALVVRGGKPSPGLAGIRLVNTKFGRFVGNEFRNINNAQFDAHLKPITDFNGSGLHAFYIAHSSSRNYFEGNHFLDHRSGSVIKIRDSSHGNVILRNSFDLTSTPIQIWHCEVNERGVTESVDDPKTEEDETGDGRCSKHPENRLRENYECLSFDTKEDQNLFLRSKSGRRFSSKASIFSIFEWENYACRPRYSNVRFDSEGRIVNEGIIQRTKQLTGSIYFGRCDSKYDCVNARSECFAQDTGSDHLLCFQNDWKACNMKTNLLTAFGKTACVPNKEKTDAVWTPIPSGDHFVKTLNGRDTNWNFCSAPNSCINPKNICYADMTGSDHSLCDSGKWAACNLTYLENANGDKAKLLKQNSTKQMACLPTSDEKDAVWTPVPAGKFFIISPYQDRYFYGLCSTSTSCVNGSGVCYTNNTGSPRLWCENSKWKICSSSTAGTKSGTRTCKKVTINGKTQYNWK